MYAEQWKEEDFYEYVTRDRVKEEKNKEPEKEKEENELDKPYRGEWNYPPVPAAAKQQLAEKALSEVEQRVRGELTKKEQKRVRKSEKKERKRKETIRKGAEAKKEIDRKKREKERRKEEYEFSLFWKRVMPGVVSFRLHETAFVYPVTPVPFLSGKRGSQRIHGSPAARRL
jgi:hypothetical protein